MLLQKTGVSFGETGRRARRDWCVKKNCEGNEEVRKGNEEERKRKNEE